VNPPHRRWQAVRISSTPEQLAELDPTLESVAAAVEDVPALLAAANEAGKSAPTPGGGSTARLWELLASVASIDVAAGRILEPHLDAGAILSQAGKADSFTGTWGVFAAEAPGTRLAAQPADQPGNQPGGVQLTGSKPWCSLAQFVDHAVVTAHTATGGRAAFAVDLRDAGVTCTDPEWTSRGLREIPSGTVHFDRVAAVPLGDDGWYFQRPGFAWGGMGVAACWLGGAVALGRYFKAALIRGAQSQREPDQVALAGLGEVDRILTSTSQYLARAAELIDGGRPGSVGAPPAQAQAEQAQAAEGAGPAAGAWSEALRVRGTVAAAVERVQLLVSQNLGPGPLAFDDRYGKCIADLSLYVRQHHAMRDDAQLGALTLNGEHPW
jgi:alkylation response protein AidB-like acyl-CoA dehydrogenase